MVRRSKRRHADEIRAKFFANREKVRAWVDAWHCPEIDWPEVPATPSLPIIGGGEQAWLKNVPSVPEYQWLLHATPVTEGVTSVHGLWWFGREHEFDRLEIRTRTYADAAYLAEVLTLGVHAGALKGWEDADAQSVYEWLFEGLDSRPMEDAVRGSKRVGFVLLEVLRFPHSRTEIDVRLTVRQTSTALDGTPLDGNAEPISR